MEINVLLGKVSPKELGAGVDYYKIVHNAYTSQYLQNLGIEPLEQHRKVVARKCALTDCQIEATWADGSVVAEQLRIVPPGARARGGRGAWEKNFEAGLPGQVSEPLMNALPPDTAGIYEKAKKGTGSFLAQKKYTQEERFLLAFSEMTVRDQENSHGADCSLTEDLETLQSQARGEEGPVHKREVLRQWGKEGFEELELLKRKFILPFACSRGSNGTISWQSPELLKANRVQVPAELVPELRKPLRISVEQLQLEAADYAENAFPLELLSTRRDPLFFDDVRQLLCSHEISRLIGLCAHLPYWNTFAHLHPPQRRLPETTRQSLVLTMQESWSRLEELARSRLCKADARAREFFVPVFLLFLKWGIEKALLLQYPKFLQNADHGEDATTQLVDQINVAIMCLFDPDCAAANFGTLDSSSEAIRLWRKLHINQMKHGLTPATRTIAREFRTSPMMLLLMHGDGSGPTDPKTRRLLQNSSSGSVLAAVTGLPPAAEGSRRTRSVGPLDAARKAMLYNTAVGSRLARLAPKGTAP
ncbi:MCAT [Symbiodinium pilosum]|uniref:MCAT protein n=1 Tax=Symbiodinium pilosum TaxID=2952 RepID=A0A812YHF5_SYMPI|nr:MCAT [Symbiodinium pilosum]